VISLFTPGPFRRKLWIGDLSETVIEYLPGLSFLTAAPFDSRWMVKPGPTSPTSFLGVDAAMADAAKPPLTTAAVAPSRAMRMRTDPPCCLCRNPRIGTDRTPGALEPYRLARPRGPEESLDHACLSDSVLPAEQRPALAADGIAEVLQLEAVRICRRELDPLHAVVPPQLDDRPFRLPGIVKEDRALGADRFHLVP